MGIALSMNVNSKILRIVSFKLDITLLLLIVLVERSKYNEIVI